MPHRLLSKTAQPAALFGLIILLLVSGLAAQPARAQAASAKVTNVRAALYAGPGLGFWNIGGLRRNVVVPVTGVSADRAFWYVETSIGNGYVRAQDVAVTGGESVAVIDPGLTASITTGVANVRGGPGPDAKRLGSLPGGQQFYVLSQQPDGGWIEIRWKYGTGWVKAELTSLAGSTPVAAAPTTDGPYAIVDTGNLNVRSGPGLQYTILGSVAGGDILPILGRTEGGVWLLVSTVYGEGWVNSIKVITRNYFGGAGLEDAASTGAEIDYTATTRTAVNVRSGPNLGFTSLGVLPTGTVVTVVGQSADKAWWLCDTELGRGWINKAVVKTKRDYSDLPVAS
jgi:uncharacterized protein YgiM (DUF1202 family)